MFFLSECQSPYMTYGAFSIQSGGGGGGWGVAPNYRGRKRVAFIPYTVKSVYNLIVSRKFSKWPSHNYQGNKAHN